MKLKRIFAGALCLCLCASLWTGGAPAKAAGITAPAFVDIPDSAQAESAELLRLLGVVAGDGAGHFTPDHRLSRAEFCTMAIGVRQETDKADALKNYTIFNDVKGDHWARGFINYAARITVGDSGERLVAGVGNANFAPDDPIEFAAAVTMVVRLLGYSQKDVPSGGNWYSCYMTVAREAGLLEGLPLDPLAHLTRGQAAVLFRNLLFADMKDGGSTFFAALGGSQVENVILLSTNATAADGTTGCLEVDEKGTHNTYKTSHAAFDAALQGARVDLMLDKDQRVISVREVTAGSRRTVTLGAHEATYITTAAGERINIPADATFYLGNEQSKYIDVYMDLKAGGRLTLAYDRTGKLEYAYLAAGESAAYEVATRLTAVYEAASPSPRTPLTVQVLKTNFTVLESAVEELAAFTPGDRVTFLLTHDGKVAGAVKPENGKSTLVCVVTDYTEEKDSKNVVTARNVTVETVMTINAGEKMTFSGKVTSSAEKLKGQLVTISSSSRDYLTLTQVPENGSKGALNVGSRTLGGEALADRVYLYERTAGGAPKEIQWDQITVATVPAAQISYTGTDESGKVNLLILDDVTGDGYIYGNVFTLSVNDPLPDLNDPDKTVDNFVRYARVTNSSEKTDYRTLLSSPSRSTPGGIAIGTNGLATKIVTLTEIKRVPRSSFDPDGMTVKVSGVTYPIAKNVECYNKATGLWCGTGAEGLAAARAYGESLSVYYDKAPSEGGKIRMVVVG